MSVPKADPRASESSDSSSGGPGNNQKMDVKMFIKYVHKDAVWLLVCAAVVDFFCGACVRRVGFEATTFGMSSSGFVSGLVSGRPCLGFDRDIQFFGGGLLALFDSLTDPVPYMNDLTSRTLQGGGDGRRAAAGHVAPAKGLPAGADAECAHQGGGRRLPEVRC
jgi:hypothetical protein